MDLKRQLRLTQAVLGLMLVGGIALAAAPQQDVLKAREIVLSDPNGGSEIHLRASPESSGMWIGDGDEKGNVAIYQSTDQAVIGAYGQNGKGLDVALATGENGPGIQLASHDKRVVLTPANLNQEAESDYTIRFVPASQ